MPNGDYLNIADFTTKEQPKNADDCVFDLRADIRSANCNIRWWFELPDDEAYKRDPNLRFDLHRTSDPRLAFPGYIGIAVLFFSDRANNDPFIREHRQMYLDGYLSGWQDFQSYSERSVRFGLQSIQDRKKAFFDQFVEYRTKHIGKGFHAPLLRQLGHDAGFMFALAFELREIDATIPISQRAPFIEPNPGLAGFITREQEKILKFIKAELAPCKRPQGKLIAEIIIVLRDSGYFVQTQGKLTKIHKAFCDMFPGKVAELSGINDYINSRDNHNYEGPKKITNDELNQLQQKLKNFVE